MLYAVIKALLSGAIIAAVSEVAKRSPALGAIIFSLPLTGSGTTAGAVVPAEPTEAAESKELDLSDLSGDWGDGKTPYPVERPFKIDLDRMEVSYPDEAKPSDDFELVAGISPREAEAAAFTLEQIAEAEPRLLSLEDDLMELSDGSLPFPRARYQGRVCHLLASTASPHATEVACSRRKKSE